MLLRVYILLITLITTASSSWNELQYELFERNLVQLGEQFFPMDFQDVLDFEVKARSKRQLECPDGNGRYGFNSYNLLTFVVLGFNAVSNAIANVNNNDNNNNNNNNKNDIGSVSGTSQDTSVGSSSMTMVMVIVPPIGPPIPVILGRALFNNDTEVAIFLDEKLDSESFFFEIESDDEDNMRKVFQNGTILLRNGTKEDGEIFYGLVDANSPKQILDIRPYIGMADTEEVDFNMIRKLNTERKSRQSRFEASNQSSNNGSRYPLTVTTLTDFAKTSMDILSKAYSFDLEVINQGKAKTEKCFQYFFCQLKKPFKFIWGNDKCEIESENTDCNI